MPFAIQISTDATDFLAACGAELLATRDTAANFPLGSTFALHTHEPSAAPVGDDNLWLSVRWETHIARPGLSDLQPMLPVNALCTVSLVGPPFSAGLCSSLDPAQITPAERVQAMEALAGALAGTAVPTTRVASVVGPRTLLEPFADAWARLRSVRRISTPHLHMYLTHVTPSLLRASRAAARAVSSASEWEMRRATRADLDATAPMNQKFEERYTLSDADARAHAGWLIDTQQLWVGAVRGRAESMVVLRRPTPGVRAISKVWTNEGMRGQGLAASLVCAACEWAFSIGAEKVCLFVEPTNPSAIRCYGSVGFVGLQDGVLGAGSEEWMDVGFEF